ncbi:MAG: SDR family NAD(P)-dependent oxidoreductase [Hyphomicrobiaceae bacterium]|nr:SDR family NAD(P)-dependent oxidoreductase [Hyphomicrobiaceae bacterium]
MSGSGGSNGGGPAGTSSSRRLAGRIALVTGASRGLGRAIALALAAEGAHVVISARTAGALEEVDDLINAAGGKATILQLDMKRLDRVDQLGPALYERWGKLDILIGNAGTLGNLTPLAHVTDDVWDYTLNLNLGANFRLIRTLDPLLKRSDAGRAIFITSGAARKSTAYWGPYAVSKAALETLVKTYAAEIATTSVQACLLNPGSIRTAMRAKAFPGEDPDTLPTPEDVAPVVVELALPSAAVNGRTFEYAQLRDAATVS